MLDMPIVANNIQDATFPCLWKNPRFNYYIIMMWIFTLAYGGLLFYVSIQSGIWVLLLMGAILLVLPLFITWFNGRFKRRSCYVITSDGYIEARYYGRKMIRYPISEIQWLKNIDGADGETPGAYHACYPVSFGRGSEMLLPDTGVIVSFNRSLLKSVLPIVFHPTDPDAFISAILTRNPSVEVR